MRDSDSAVLVFAARGCDNHPVTGPRSPIPPASSDSCEAEAQLVLDRDALELAESRGETAFRTWTSATLAVVVGRAVTIDDEVDIAYCRARSIPIVRRDSGGRSVAIGPGTVQYTFALPYELFPQAASIGGAKRYCNSLLIAALPDARDVEMHASGDLTVDGRKVAGLALRRRRSAVLLHGTILTGADIATIGRVLKHPVREPEYRRGRDHESFLANLGPIDPEQLERDITRALQSAAPMHGQAR